MNLVIMLNIESQKNHISESIDKEETRDWVMIFLNQIFLISLVRL